MREFPINDVYMHEASKLLQAKEAVTIVHKTGDIDASGDELEIPFREMLSKRLPSKYYVGQGHIVDSNMKASPQFDVIISDASTTQILFDGKNGTQYFPYESVYAVGEVKSSYYKNRKYVENFCLSIKSLLDNFTREPVSSSYIGNGINLGKSFDVEGSRQIQNPFFSFMLFGSINDLKVVELNEQLNSSKELPHPNIMCFLDGTIISKCKVDQTVIGGPYHTTFVTDPIEQKNESLKMTKIDFLNEEKSGQALAILMLSLLQHLSLTMLKPPQFDKYVNSILKNAKHSGTIIYE